MILDTNVVSEMMKPKVDVRFALSMAKIDRRHQFVTSVTLADLRYGVALLPEGRRKRELAFALEGFIHEDVVTPILPFAEQDAAHYADIVAGRRALVERI